MEFSYAKGHVMADSNIYPEKAIDEKHRLAGSSTCYEFMGIDRDASSSDIKKAFIVLSGEFRPDRHQSPLSGTVLRALLSSSAAFSAPALMFRKDSPSVFSSSPGFAFISSSFFLRERSALYIPLTPLSITDIYSTKSICPCCSPRVHGYCKGLLQTGYPPSSS